MPCRYHGIVEKILQEIDIIEDNPPALLEHIISSYAGSGPDLRRMFVSNPHAGTESIDLLMCAASMGNDSVLSALIRAGLTSALLRPPNLLEMRSGVLLIASASTSCASDWEH